MDGSHIPLPFISESFLKENASLEPLPLPAAHLERDEGWSGASAGAPQGSGSLGYRAPRGWREEGCTQAPYSHPVLVPHQALHGEQGRVH